MKKIIVLLLVGILLLSGCNNNSDKGVQGIADMDKIVENKLNSMTIDEKIGQMMIIYYLKGSVDTTLLMIILLILLKKLSLVVVFLCLLQ